MAASPHSSDDGFAIGSVLDGRYRVEAVLGTGGMGRVYRAEHINIGRSVAIKVLHADLTRNREASQRFQREAIASGRLDHPNIVGVSDFGVLDTGACYLVMEVLEGESLGERLVRDRRLPWREALDILRGVLHGLRHAHERGVVHRDIKPDNVYLARKDGEPVVKILDFGIAKLYAGSEDDPASTRAGLTVGTPAYLSPEQAVGSTISPASDLYSATIVLYEMLAGRAPFEDRDPLMMLGAHVSRPPPRFSDIAPGVEIPTPLEDIIQRGLRKLPADRIGNATDYLALIDAFSPPAPESPWASPPSAASTSNGAAPNRKVLSAVQAASGAIAAHIASSIARASGALRIQGTSRSSTASGASGQAATTPLPVTPPAAVAAVSGAPGAASLSPEPAGTWPGGGASGAMPVQGGAAPAGRAARASSSEPDPDMAWPAGGRSGAMPVQAGGGRGAAPAHASPAGRAPEGAAVASGPPTAGAAAEVSPSAAGVRPAMSPDAADAVPRGASAAGTVSALVASSAAGGTPGALPSASGGVAPSGLSSAVDAAWGLVAPSAAGGLPTATGPVASGAAGRASGALPSAAGAASGLVGSSVAGGSPSASGPAVSSAAGRASGALPSAAGAASGPVASSAAGRASGALPSAADVASGLVASSATRAAGPVAPSPAGAAPGAPSNAVGAAPGPVASSALAVPAAPGAPGLPGGSVALPVQIRSGAMPVDGVSGALAAPRVSLEMAQLPRAARAMSFVDMSEPIPLSWIVRSAVVIGLVLIGAIALAIGAHCRGAGSPLQGAVGSAAGSGAATSVAPPPAAGRTSPALPTAPRAPHARVEPVVKATVPEPASTEGSAVSKPTAPGRPAASPVRPVMTPGKSAGSGGSSRRPANR